MLTVLVLYYPVKKDACHGYSATGEKWVIIHSIADFDTGWGVDIAGEKRKYVVLWRKLEHGVKERQNAAYTTTMTGLDD